MTTCATCGTEFSPPKRYDKVPRPPARYCSRPCANAGTSRATANQRSEKLRGDGNGRTYAKRNGRHEHRAVAEQKIGRALLPGEIVHHLNGDKRDNRPENLEVITQSEHARKHAAERLAARGGQPACSADGCERPSRSGGMCTMHYQRGRKEVVPNA